MIKIRVERDRGGRLTRVLITGHADFDEHGRDILCAAVSGLSIGLVNAIETMFGVRVHADDDAPGKLDCRLSPSVDPEKAEKIRLIMEAMVVALRNMADEYPDHVTIYERHSD
ncbi:ribosomal-processing cysteine protease Prp [Staphylospora marina]|uniref:ribosomal-processing cysteine protease Prp n=1 Tax=Staphylospora marina TaxID=2490858 RepID=UPI000F5BB5E4|nr:ribosomal-processing cysteine protease Prp [Staphylospora marina]